MVLLDNSVIFTGLPSIRAGLGLSAAQLSWVQDSYVLVFGGLLLLAARAGDIVGRRRLFIVGLAIFGAASLLVGVAPSAWWMIAARALQGVGAAIVAPTSLALITTYFHGEARRRAVAWYAAAAGIGASAGLLIGGAVTEWLSWRAAFLINVPIAVAMMVAAHRILAETDRRTGRFDAVGAVVSTLGVGSLVYGVITSSETGWGSSRVVGSLTVGVLLLVLLAINESRADQPIMPLRLFASRERSGAYAVRFLYLGAMMGFFYFTTQLMQDALGFTPFQAGLGFLPMTAVNFAVALTIPRLARRYSTGTLLLAGTFVTLAGMAWLSRASLDDSYLLSVAAPMVLIGIGQGLAFAPMTGAGIARVSPDDAGAASGVVNTAHQLGSAMGLAVLVAISSGIGGLSTPDGVVAQVSAALSGSAVLLLVATVIVAVVIVPAQRNQPEGVVR
ncbi:MFS transporter [Gordonia sp. TBRC 11910]|uniref:MFS transporter n=2 Tax=Gordonia asplenii TaxID=2725283 RepID=A0A848KUK7_9ACTN|nr:MFS transporter [Gordonia asplenii]